MKKILLMLPLGAIVALVWLAISGVNSGNVEPEVALRDTGASPKSIAEVKCAPQATALRMKPQSASALESSVVDDSLSVDGQAGAASESCVAEKVVASAGETASNMPACRLFPKTSPLSFRKNMLPPKNKGGAATELREWLVKPDPADSAYVYHVEEEYADNGNGEQVLVASRQYVANQIIVKLDGETSVESLNASLASVGGEVHTVLMTLEKNAKLVSVRVPEVDFESAERLVAATAKISSCSEPSLDMVSTINTTVPNDSNYSTQWALPKISAPSAWDIQKNASSIVVAVLDTGVRYDHVDLAANMWVNPSQGTFSGVTGDRYGMRCIDGVKSGNPMDDNGHGSHCAGIIGAVADNSKGVAGVCWNAKIMALKAGKTLSGYGSSATFTDSDTMTCMQYAREKGAKVVNCSFGGTGSRSSAYQSAFSAMRTAGIIMVCAAGNGGADGVGDNNDTLPTYPASLSYDNIISVAATTSSDALTSFSNYGVSSVDIAAPGYSINSTIATTSSSYGYKSGTSMAAPFVSGAAALVWAKYPSATYSEIISRILDGGDAVSALSGKVKTGRRLNVLKALQSATLIAPTPTASRGTYAAKTVVSWNAVSGATHYKVWRAATSTGAKTALTSWITATSYEDTTGTAGTGYYYFVQAAASSSGANASAYSASAYGYRTATQTYPDQWDPGDDTKSGATLLTATGVTQSHGPHGLNASDLNDYFKVYLTSGRGYIFETTGSSDTYGELYNASGAKVAYNDDGGTNSNFRLSYTAAATGYHYLRVCTWRTHYYGSDETGSKSYTLKYQSMYPDSYDPADDTTSGATLITPTTTVATTPSHGLNAYDSYDFFKVYMTAGQTYCFESVSSYDIYAELYNSSTVSSSTRVAYDDDSGTGRNFKLTYTPSTSGYYYLRVRRYLVGSEGVYSVKYWKTVPSQHDVAFYKPSNWSAPVFLTTDPEGTTPMTEFMTNETVYVRYAFTDNCNNSITQPFSNLVYIAKAATPNTIYRSVYNRVSTLPSGKYITQTGVEINFNTAGSYVFGVALNLCSVGSQSSSYGPISETNYQNNAYSIPIVFRAETPKTLTSVSIAGAGEVVEGNSSRYTATLRFSDGTTQNEAPVTWTVVSGSNVGSFTTNGIFVARDVTTRTAVTIQASYTYRGLTKTATKEIVVKPRAEPPFGAPIAYPTPPMTVVASVTMDGVAANAGDVLAAYCGEELRGSVELNEDGVGVLSIAVAEAGEQILFKAWNSSTDKVLSCADPLTGEVGGVVGSPSDPYEIACCTSDPFGTVPQQPNAPMTIVARVSIYGEQAESQDMIAVYCGNELRGKASVSMIDNVSYAVLTVQVRENGEQLVFKVWDASEEVLANASGFVTSAIGGVVGSPTAPHLIRVLQDVTQSIKVSATGWQLFSVNVNAEDDSPQAVFGAVTSKFERVNCDNEVYSPTWDPAYNTIGGIAPKKAYWIKVKSDAVVPFSFSLTGAPADCSTEQIALSAGWNCIGYLPQQVGAVQTVLSSLIDSGKLELVSGDGKTFNPTWPSGWSSLEVMKPGVGYWVKVTQPVTFAYVEPTGSESLSLAGLSSFPTGCPWSEDDLDKDTVFPVTVKGEISLFGDLPAFGEVVVAAFANGNTKPCAVQSVNAAGGVAMGISKSSGTVLTFKVWDALNNVTYNAETTITLVSGEDLVERGIVVSGTKPTYQVTFDLTGVSGGNGTRSGGGALVQQVVRGESAIPPTVNPANGYVFQTWDASYQNIKQAITIHACYGVGTAPSPAAYTVRFHKNDGTTTTSDQSFSCGVAQGLAWKDSQLKWTRTGYTFIGWALDAGSGLVKYANGEKVKDIAAKGEVKHLYAVWANNYAYTVVYHNNTPTGDTVQVKHLFWRGTGKSLAWKDSQLAWANPSGYTFLGWATSASGAVVYSNGQKVNNIALGGKTIHLYAKWKANAYTVRYHYNYGTDTRTADQAFTYGKEQALKWLDSGLKWPHPQSANFLGWAETANGAKKYANGQSVKNLTTANNGVVHLYAKWNLITVRFHKNTGGTDVTAFQYFKPGVAQCLTWKDSGLKWTTPSGKLFVGWGLKANAKVANYANGASVKNPTSAGNTLDLYAIWAAADSYIVKLYRNHSSTDETVAYQGVLRTGASLAWKDSVLGWANPSGKTLLGWSKTRTATTATYKNGATVTGLAAKGSTVALYAIWSTPKKSAAARGEVTFSSLQNKVLPAAPQRAVLTWAPGYYRGLFAGDAGTFDLLLGEFDEDGVADAYFAAQTADGLWTEECEAMVVGETLALTLEDRVVILSYQEGELVATE